MPRRERESDRDRDGKEKEGEPKRGSTAGIAIEQMYQIYEKLNSAEDKTKVLS